MRNDNFHTCLRRVSKKSLVTSGNSEIKSQIIQRCKSGRLCGMAHIKRKLERWEFQTSKRLRLNRQQNMQMPSANRSFKANQELKTGRHFTNKTNQLRNVDDVDYPGRGISPAELKSCIIAKPTQSIVDESPERLGAALLQDGTIVAYTSKPLSDLICRTLQTLFVWTFCLSLLQTTSSWNRYVI